MLIYAYVAWDQWHTVRSLGMAMMYAGYAFAGIGAILVMKAAEALARAAEQLPR